MSKGSQRWGQALSRGLWADPGCCPHTCPHTGPGPHCPHGHDGGMWLHAGSSLSCHPWVLAQVRVPPGVPRVAQCDRELRAITPSPLGHGGRMKRGPLAARPRGDPYGGLHLSDLHMLSKHCGEDSSPGAAGGSGAEAGASAGAAPSPGRWRLLARQLCCCSSLSSCLATHATNTLSVFISAFYLLKQSEDWMQIKLQPPLHIIKEDRVIETCMQRAST